MGELPGLKKPSGKKFLFRWTILLFLALFFGMRASAEEISSKKEVLTLIRALEILKENNLELQELQAEIRRMEAKNAEARALPGPTLRFTSSYSESRGAFGGFFAGISFPGGGGGFSPMQAPPAPSGAQTTKALIGSASYLLFSGGKIQAWQQQARLGLVIAKKNYEKRLKELELEVVKAYLNVLEAKHLLEVAERTRENLKELLRVTQLRFEAGTAPRVEVLRAETEVANAEVQVIQAKNAVDTAYAFLMNILNLPQTEEWELEEVAPPEKRVEISLEEAKEKGWSLRPEKQIAEYALALSREGIKIHQADRYPSFSFSHTRAWLESPFFRDKTSWSAGLTASWLIFDAGATRARIRQAYEEMQKSRARYERLRSAVELEITQVWNQVKFAEEAYEAAKRGMETAREALRISLVRYEAGFGLQLEVLDAHTSFARAQFGYFRALYQLIYARASLNKALAQPIL
ncbi:MAG: TolC family protein [bacterium]